MSLSVKYMDIPVGAQEAAVAEATVAQPFGSAELLTVGAEDMPWATLEPGSWALDGSRVLMDDAPQNIGWWSMERTDENGRFGKPPVITVSFPQPYTATGITFTFWPSMGQWCDAVEVTWYNGQTVLAQTKAEPDSAKWVLARVVEGFDRIEIALLGTNKPMQFAKLQNIQIGQVVIFLQDELVRVNLLNEMDPSLCQMSADTMTVEVLEKKDRYLMPQKNQSMYLYRDGVQIATQYITDSSRENQRFYTFRCQSAIGRLEDDFFGGIYNAYPLDTLLEAVLDGFQADWTAFAGKTVTGYLPVCTRREALQQIAFAMGAAVTTQGDGTIRLTPVEDICKEVGSFEDHSIFSGAKVSREAQTAAVRLLVHSYGVGGDTETLLNEEEIEGEDVLYVFSSPHYDYQITNGSVTGSGVNWVRITANSKVTLTARKYVHSTSVRAKTNALATAAERGNVVTVENATLVHAGNADVVLDRLYAYHTLKNVLTQDVVVTDQRAGGYVRSPNPWGTVTEGYITAMESEFTNSGHTAGVTIRGKEEV